MALRYDMFETSTAEPPIASGLYTTQAPKLLVALNAWQDLQGAVRFTLESGTQPLTLDGFYLQVTRSDEQAYAQTVTPVPEPSSVALFGLGGCVLVFAVMTRSKRRLHGDRAQIPFRKTLALRGFIASQFNTQ